MATKRRKIDDDEGPEAELRPNAIDDEARPGETMQDYMERMDADESKWRGKQGGRGAKKHDRNESRHPTKVSEFWDPHLGAD